MYDMAEKLKENILKILRKEKIDIEEYKIEDYTDTIIEDYAKVNVPLKVRLTKEHK
jgi:hypothetical protein